MDAKIRELLQIHGACIRQRQWTRLAYRLSRDLNRTVTPKEAKHLGHSFRKSRHSKKSPQVKVSTDNAAQDQCIVEVTGSEGPIKTLEDLVDAARVDLETWAVTHWTANTWTNNGRDNWQVKAHLVKKFDRDEFLESLVVGPHANTPYRQVPPTQEGNLLVIPDCQIGLFWDKGKLLPYHDRLAMDTVWKVAQHQQPETIVIVGDFLDLAIWSTKFQREPKDRYTTKFALQEARWWLTRLRRENPDARIVFLEGNHEKRIQTVLIEYFQELLTLDMIDVPTLLGVADLGIEYKGPYGKEATYFFNDQLIGFHGDLVRQGGGATTAFAVKGKTTSMFFGHTHRLGFSSRAIHTPKGVKVISAMEVGCACRLDGAVPGDNSPDWAHGYGWITCKDGCVYQMPIMIHDGRTVTPDGTAIHGVDCGRLISQGIGENRISF